MYTLTFSAVCDSLELYLRRREAYGWRRKSIMIFTMKTEI